MPPAPGTRVIVTGGASGIGRAIAEAFAAAGACLWVIDPGLEALDTCPDTWGRSPVDVSDEQALRQVFSGIGERWGGVDVLCANAGIAGPTAPVEQVVLDDWRRCVAVNLEGAFLAAKHAIPLMKPTGAGAITLTSSTAGLHGYPNRAPYAAAKWGVIGLMKTLAMELGPFGIRVNALCPGAVEGPRMDGVLMREAAAKGMTVDAVRAGYAAGTSMRRWVTADDVAAMALFLGSPEARLISGQAIAIDGHTENPDPKPGSP
ncbi:MAG TPA: SDR family oxidoreductase [Thermohalobaculum sp.]|nr:SDR family oxidoreductase [Thermohalobaculum sp.]